MKQVILLGDSIRWIGYGAPTAERLKNEANVWQPKCNCEFALYTLCHLQGWLKEADMQPDVIHWNNGLWDSCVRYEQDGAFVSIDEYARTIFRIARELKKAAPKVIFATTTPVRPDKADNTAERIRAYNAAVVSQLMQMGVEINDLHSAVAADIPRYIRASDSIHLSPDGIELCTSLVTAHIKAAFPL